MFVPYLTAKFQLVLTSHVFDKTDLQNQWNCKTRKKYCQKSVCQTIFGKTWPLPCGNKRLQGRDTHDLRPNCRHLPPGEEEWDRTKNPQGIFLPDSHSCSRRRRGRRGRRESGDKIRERRTAKTACWWLAGAWCYVCVVMLWLLCVYVCVDM